MPAKMGHVPLMSHKPFVALNTSRMKTRVIIPMLVHNTQNIVDYYVKQ